MKTTSKTNAKSLLERIDAGVKEAALARGVARFN